MQQRRVVTMDGNEAAAGVAYRASEVVAIYPITPASPMGELADAWSASGRPNVFGQVPAVAEMQSEGGAAGAVHGSLQAGALTTTFTASQGLLLMIPNMYKIAGELTPTVMHVAARTVATHALSIFGDHSDVMAVRQCGWAMLCASSVAEAQDMALVAHAAALRSRVPFLHFFDGFRTSHELNKVERLSDDDVRSMLDRESIAAFRGRALDPDRPVLRGSAQNPDVFFQAREACSPYYAATPGIVLEEFERLSRLTGRRYGLFEYYGDPDAETVLVLMGSGVGAAREAVETLHARGRRVGALKVRLYRPFCVSAFLDVLPPTVRSIAVLDRTKEPGSVGEPLYLDVCAALSQGWAGAMNGASPPRVIGGRYGLSSKEFTPAMALAVLEEASSPSPKQGFTVGIADDVSRSSVSWDRSFSTQADDVTRAVFFGLGSDGTVGACKNTAKIVAERSPLHVQAYFVYDSKKAGSVTSSHLRFSPRVIRSSYLVTRANFISCSQFHFLEHIEILEQADPGATFLLNSPYRPEKVWGHLPIEVQEQIVSKNISMYAVDAHLVAREAGLAGRINTVMQVCAFSLLGVLAMDEAMTGVEASIRSTYGKRGESVVDRNLRAARAALSAMHRVDTSCGVTATSHRGQPLPAEAPDFVRRVTRAIIEGRGDLLPVSAMPADGTFPTGTSKYEKRGIAQEIPVWDPEICIQCGLCSLVCPHAAIRTKSYGPEGLSGAPDGFKHAPGRGKDFDGRLVTIQVAPDDCTGCAACVAVCPARSKSEVKHQAINMEPRIPHLERERAWFDHFLGIPLRARGDIRLETIKGSQMAEPLFEYSGACAGCGETPYLKLVTQLFGDRMIVANATGCSSIYGGNLPTTPWCTTPEGRGPAWANSLFEDNAEFGFGIRLAVRQRTERARELVASLSPMLGEDLAGSLLASSGRGESFIAERRSRVAELRERLRDADDDRAAELLGVADLLVPRSTWIIGGDGWAYDIGFGGLDHVLASREDVNVLVLDTEVYSNTGGQASKSTPRAAVAKFASGGKPSRKKDLGMIAMAYGNAYVAQIALGANPQHALTALIEAERHDGPSLVIAYSHCIAHGIDMATANGHQKEAVTSGYWPLYRFDPARTERGEGPFRLDSRRPRGRFRDFAEREGRFAVLMRTDPERAEGLLRQAQRDIDERFHWYEQMQGVERSVPAAAGEQTGESGPGNGAAS